MHILCTYKFDSTEELEDCISELERCFGNSEFGLNGYAKNRGSFEIDINENISDLDQAKEVCEEYGVLYKVNGSMIQAG